MTRLLLRSSWMRIWSAGGGVLLLGGCGLSDQQLAQIFQSVFTTGLTTFVSTLAATLAGG